MKLTAFGGPGPRAARSITGGDKLVDSFKPLSRAQHAKPTYGGGQNPTPNQHAQDLAGSGTNQQNQGSSTSSATDAAAGAMPDPAQYDLNADPVLQQVQAAVTLGDQQANTAALQAREQLLEQYGDPGLAASNLGANDPMVKAAGANPESTLALLKRGYTQGLTNYENTLDPSLIYSGARVHDEGLMGQQYQDRLAQAAAAVQSGLAGITGNLNSALASGQDKYDAALADAYNRAVQNALTNPPAASSTPAPKKQKIAHAAGGKKGRHHG